MNATQPGASNTRIQRVLVTAMAILVILVASPSASAPSAEFAHAGFAPVTRVSFGDAEVLTPAIKLRNEALNRSLPANPALAVPAKSFSLHALGAEPAAYISALDCMTAAIYYEAAHEPVTGRRAVAQVILNRVRHPAFPDTVCGVVFQGSERKTGCQFTFTCDGSLSRTPVTGLWLSARAIAAAALGGFVETSVGHATHYHASYVLPYWAGNLTKLRTIGSHIFYQWKGGWSAPSAFTDRYAMKEAMPLTAQRALGDHILTPPPLSEEMLQLAAAPTRAETGSALPAVQAAPRIAEADAARGNGAASRSTLLEVAPSRMIEREARLKDAPAPSVLPAKGMLAQ